MLHLHIFVAELMAEVWRIRLWNWILHSGKEQKTRSGVLFTSTWPAGRTEEILAQHEAVHKWISTHMFPAAIYLHLISHNCIYIRTA